MGRRRGGAESAVSDARLHRVRSDNVLVRVNKCLDRVVDELCKIDKYGRVGQFTAASDNAVVPLNSALTRWKESVITNDVSPGSIVSSPTTRLVLDHYLEEITDDLEHTDVFLLESPTGSGKTMLMPGLLLRLTRTCTASGWKAVHFVPTGEQAAQHVEFARVLHHGIRFGVSTTLIDQQSARQLKDVPLDANYIYTTSSFAEHALGGTLHAVIIDDVHALTPESIKLLCLVRDELKIGRVRKVILLSASLSDGIRTKFLNFFSEFRVKNRKISCGKPFSDKVVCADDWADFNMREAMRHKRDQHNLYNTEETRSGSPNVKELIERSVDLQGEILNECKRLYSPRVHSPLGFIAFSPGQREINKSKASLAQNHHYRHITENKLLKIDRIKICGKDRSDLEFLKRQYQIGEPVRVIHSSPLFSSGITLPGVHCAIDDGLMKLPGRYCHSGVIELETIYEDRVMLLQKQGRVSRTSRGDFYIVVSRKRFEEILQTYHSLIILDRAFATNHIPWLLENLHQVMIPPSPGTMAELLLDMNNTGFLETSWMPTPHAKALVEAFPVLPLVLSDFLLRCSALDVTMHSMVLVASILAEWHAILHPGGEERRGRGSPKLPINRWSSIAPGLNSDSDIEVYTEMALNLMLSGPGRLFEPMSEYMVEISCRRDVVDVNGIEEMWRQFIILYNSLRAIDRVPATLTQFFEWELREEGAYEKIHNEFDGKNTLYRLKKHSQCYFRVCILSSLGSRVLYEAREEDQHPYGVRTIYMLGGEQPPQVPRLVQGEMAVKSKKKLAIYYEVMRRAPHENFCTGFLHPVTTTEYALFGNAIGSVRDEVDEEARMLKINTNTTPIYYKFDDEKKLWSIVRTRKRIRCVSMAALHKDTELIKRVKRRIDNLDLNGEGIWELGGNVCGNFSPVPSDANGGVEEMEIDD